MDVEKNEEQHADEQPDVENGATDSNLSDERSETGDAIPDLPVDEIVSAEELAKLRESAAKSQEFQDNWLRSVAELQNVQRRLGRDKDMARKTAVRDLVRSLLPCFDNLERAVQSADASSPEVLIQGVSMVSGEITRLLTDAGVAIIEPAGERLDPTRHEAVFSRHDADIEESCIIEVHEKGYALGEVIIRPARVTVSLGPEAAGAADAQNDKEED